jgi:hypothetical protein
MRRLLLVLSPLTLAVLFAVPAAPALAGTGQHAAITITSNAGFSTCGCVTSGSGTAADPFVIGPWAIGAPSGGTSGWSVKVDNSGGGITDHFNISGISSTYNNTNTTDPTIWLVDVNTPTSIVGSNAHPTAGNDLGIGIELDGSSNVAIDGISYNKGNGTGIYISGSSNISINNSKLKATCDICTPHTGDGIYAINGAHDNVITTDTFTGSVGLGVASGGNGFYADACTGQNVPFSPEAAMGAGNTFSNICYPTTNITNTAVLPPSTCKS